MTAPLLEIAVGSMTAVLILREARAIIKESRESRNGTNVAGALAHLAEALTKKELRDTERHGTIVGQIKDSERRLTERIGENRK